MLRAFNTLMRIWYWLIIVPILTILGLIVAYLLLVGFLAYRDSRDWERRSVPEKLQISQVLLSQDSAGGFLEGCQFVAYKLKPESVAAIRTQGLHFFADIQQPPRVSRNFYGPWKAAPIPKSPYIFASSASDGCNNDNAVRDAVGVIDLGDPHAFYSVTQNKEGMIMVFPDRALAIYMYFG